MKPFKMFFGLSIAFMLFFFVARIAIVAFIAAAVMSIIYAVFRRVKDFVTYDSYGEPYMKRQQFDANLQTNWNQQIEPLFHAAPGKYRSQSQPVKYIQAI